MKYLKAAPLMLYPYAYLIAIFLSVSLLKYMDADASGIAGLVIVVAYQILVLGYIIYSFIMVRLGNYTASDAAKLNLFVKGMQIPAYLFHFLLGLLGTIMSIWGIGFIMLAMIVDFITIFLTGLHACSAAFALHKWGVVSKKKAWILGISSFFYCIDLITAVYMAVLAHKFHKRETA